jgi:hypothetical protein
MGCEIKPGIMMPVDYTRQLAGYLFPVSLARVGFEEKLQRTRA